MGTKRWIRSTRIDAAGGAAEPLRARLRAVYAEAARSMAGLPIVNPALSVDIPPPRRWRQGWLALPVTPWCLSLVYLPADPVDETGDWAGLRPGDTALLSFAAGRYRFVKFRHDVLGPTMSCALVSPMGLFADQEAAMATAREILAALDESAPASDGSPPPRRVSRRAFLNGGGRAP